MFRSVILFAPVCREAAALRLNHFWARIIATVAIAIASLLGSEDAVAAISGKADDLNAVFPNASYNGAGGKSENGSPRNPQKQFDKDSASAAISGSLFPGVIDHLLQRPASSPRGSSRLDIHINYPSFGNKSVDADIREWVGGIADAFANHLDLQNFETEASEEIEKLAQEDSYNPFEQADAGAAARNFELWGAYAVSRPSPAAVSVAFELWNYTDSGQGNLDIVTLNYSLLTGQRLTLVDIFEKPDVALELMSTWSRKILQTRLGAARREQMFNDGTAPLLENFSSFTLTPDGVCINFQPWQVAPWEAGIQKVAMPLEELLPSSPLLALWGKQDER